VTIDSGTLDAARKAALAAGDGQTCRLIDEVRRLQCRVRGLHNILSREYGIVTLEVANIVAETFEPTDRQPHWSTEDYQAEVAEDLGDAIEQAMRDQCLTTATDLHAQCLTLARVLELRQDLHDIWRAMARVGD
jgi:hypothetical protein